MNFLSIYVIIFKVYVTQILRQEFSRVVGVVSMQDSQQPIRTQYMRIIQEIVARRTSLECPLLVGNSAVFSSVLRKPGGNIVLSSNLAISQYLVTMTNFDSLIAIY